jgi:hypothetical protein
VVLDKTPIRRNAAALPPLQGCLLNAQETNQKFWKNPKNDQTATFPQLLISTRYPLMNNECSAASACPWPRQNSCCDTEDMQLTTNTKQSDFHIDE